jgi:hypothetical protein
VPYLGSFPVRGGLPRIGLLCFKISGAGIPDLGLAGTCRRR